MRLPAGALVVLVGLWGGTGLAQPSSTNTPAATTWYSIPVPGGMSGAAAAAGVSDRIERWRFLTELIRRVHGEPPKGEPRSVQAKRLTDLVARLDALEPGTELVPLPLHPEFWGRSILRRSVPANRLFREILSDRTAALMYLGLASLDGPTLAFLATQPSLLEDIVRARAGGFAAFARSLHIADGTVRTPDGDQSVSAWESLVGARTTEPARFIRTLLERDDGRLAYFYDVVAHLRPSSRLFAMGGPGAATRRQRFEALYGVVRRVHPDWVIEERPLYRPPVDTGLVLEHVATTAVGELQPPAGERLWRAVFRPPSSRTVSLAGGGGEVLDAANLLTLLCLDPIAAAEQRERFETFTFAQRALGHLATDNALAGVIREFPRYRSLMLVLERMGVREIAVYERALNQAARVTRLDAPVTARSTVAQYQGALALVERATFGRVLTSSAASRLVQSLSSLAVDSTLGFGSRLAEWLGGELVPELRAALDPPRNAGSVEDVVLAAIAGREQDALAVPAHQTVVWEGGRYLVDLAAPERSRLATVRAKQGGHRLDTVLELASGLRLLTRDGDGGPADPAGPISMASRMARTLPVGVAAPRLADALEPATGSTPVRGRPTERGVRLMEMADAWLADVLVSIAYAAALGDPDGPVFLGPDVSRRHDFGLDQAEPTRTSIVWSLAEEQSAPGAPWHLTGSILALDVGLAAMRLRRIESGTMPPPPALSGTEVREFAEAVAWMNRFDLGDRDCHEIMEGVNEGRAALQSARADTGRLTELAIEVGVDAWRTAAIPWRVAHEPESLSRLLTLVELNALGRRRARAAGPSANWGPSLLGTTGCLCLEQPARATKSALARPGSSLASLTPDLKLRVAEVLDSHGLPASLAPPLLATLLRDFLDEARPAHPEDWLTLAAEAQAWPIERIDDHIAALASDGPLVSTGDGSNGEAR
jgi:hypothetical protein